MKHKFSVSLSLALILAMLVTSLAVADEVVNDIDNTISNAFEIREITAGASTVVGFYINASGDPGNDPTGCNVTLGSPATVAFSIPSVVNASTDSLTFNECNSVQTITFSSSTLGTHPISIANVTGGVTNSKWVEQTARFNLVVNPPDDDTAPLITPNVVGTLGNNGWYTSDVNVSWAISDPDSSVTSTTGCGLNTVNTDTSGVTFTCSATSAGGTNSQSVTIERDATAPTGVSGAPNRAPDHGTWYNHAVDVVFTGTDATSGIASCTTTNYSGPDGSGVAVNGSCTDNAGNTSSAVASSAFNYDGTAPTGVVLSITAGTPGLNGWYTSDVTVHTSSDADISGVICTVDQFQTTETAGTAFNGSCTNGAGLTAYAAPLTVKLDKTAPSASLAVTAGTLGANGWYTSDVTVSTSGTDSISSPVTCTADQYQTTETGGTAFNGSCTNDAGLSTNAALMTVKLDKTAPGVIWNGSINNGDSFYFGFVPAVPTCTATDALSGPGTCDVTGYSTALNSHVLTATAYDLAGNSKVETRTYTVLAWTLNGFYKPVDMTEGVWNTVKGGQTVPLKFNVFAGATELTDVGVVESFTAVKVACVAGEVEDAVEFTTTGGTSLRYDWTDGQFIQNWKTPKSTGCYRVTMLTDDGSSLVAFFKLK